MAKNAVTTAPKNEVAKVEDNNVPAYLKDVPQGSGLAGLDASDFIIPRVKLLQGLSPELQAFENAKAGTFWMNVLDLPLGEALEFIPCSNRKRYLLLPPMGDSRGVLARADDGVHWKPAKGEWQVKLKGVKNPVTWVLDAETVRESGLAEFGTSNPDDPDSNPAATLFYEFLVYLPKYPQVSPTLISLARSQAKKAKDLQSKIEFRKAPMQSQKFLMTPFTDNGAEGDFFNVAFANNGWATEQEFELCKGIAERFKEYRAADETGAAGETAPKADSKDF